MEKYDAICDELGISHLIHHTEYMDSSNHLYLIRIPGISTEQRNRFIEKMSEQGISTNVHYKPLPMMTAYKQKGFDIIEYPYSYNMHKNQLTLPMNSVMTDEEAQYVIDTFIEVYNKLT